MKSIKNFVKEHKKEVVIGGAAVLTASCILIAWKAKTPKTTEVKLPLTATFLPNKEYDTVDLFIGKGENRSHVWAFNLGEAQSLAVELNDAMACVWPQD